MMLEAVIQPIVDWFTDPFWGYLAWGALVIAIAAVIGWFFEGVRAFAGAVILSVIGALFAYRRGRADEKQRRERRRTEDGNQSWPRWPWGS